MVSLEQCEIHSKKPAYRTLKRGCFAASPPIVQHSAYSTHLEYKKSNGAEIESWSVIHRCGVPS
jgi:hypothetical protein